MVFFYSDWPFTLSPEWLACRQRSEILEKQRKKLKAGLVILLWRRPGFTESLSSGKWLPKTRLRVFNYVPSPALLIRPSCRFLEFCWSRIRQKFFFLLWISVKTVFFFLTPSAAQTENLGCVNVSWTAHVTNPAALMVPLGCFIGAQTGWDLQLMEPERLWAEITVQPLEKDVLLRQ